MSLPRNHMLYLVPSRVGKLRHWVESQVWQERRDVTVKGSPVSDTWQTVQQARRLSYSPVRSGEYFGPPQGGWKQRWFKLQIPAAKPGERGRRVLFWECHGETTVYIDGLAWAGLDVAHRYCTLPDKACTLCLDCGTYQTGIWKSGSAPDQYGLRFDAAYMVCRNEDAWNALWDLDALHSVIERQLSDAQRATHMGRKGALTVQREWPPFLRRLLTDLDEVCDKYVDGIPAVRKGLVDLYARYPAEYWQQGYAMVGHSHLDLVWLWPESVGERKGIHSTATAMRLLDRYPEFIFMWSQPAMLEGMRSRDPHLFQEVLRRTREGRLELTGALEVEVDSNVPCGEALARSLVYGQRGFEKLRGSRASVVWLPDSFGFTSCFPQVMALADVRYFHTGKLGWSTLSRFPHDSFVWKSPDGTGVVTHLGIGLDPSLHLPTAIDALRSYEQGGVHDEVLRAVGWGDGGGGPSEEICERARRMANLVGVPRARWTKVEDFFDRLNRVKEDLPVYEGEMYLETHRGTFTSQSEFKRLYRGLETALQAHEAVRVVTGGKPLGHEGWKRLLFAQFHDALPGSSIALVYQQMNPELQELAQKNLDQAAHELSRSAGRNAPVQAFNPLLMARQVVVEVPTGVRLAEGSLTQQIGHGRNSRTLAIAQLPALGTAAMGMTGTTDTQWKVTSRVLDNGLLRAGFDSRGQLIGLRVCGQDLALTGPAGFVLYPELGSDAWDIERHSLMIGKPAAASLRLQVIERGPLRAVLRGSADIGGKSKLEVDYILEAGTPYLRIECRVDWKEPHMLLKYHVRTAYLGQQARYGVAFGSIGRLQVGGMTDDQAKWEVAASRWAAVVDDAGTEGLAFITQAKYGFSCYEGDMGLSLLRGGRSPDNTADVGMHTIRFALGTYASRSEGGRLSTAAAAETLFAPVIVGPMPAIEPPLQVEEIGTAVPSWILPAETTQGVIVRLHETAGARGSAILRLARPAKVSLVDLLERPMGPCTKIDGSTWRVDYRPYQILSVLVQ